MKIIVEYVDMFVKDVVFLKKNETYEENGSQIKEYNTLKEAKKCEISNIQRLIEDAKEHIKEIRAWRKPTKGDKMK